MCNVFLGRVAVTLYCTGKKVLFRSFVILLQLLCGNVLFVSDNAGDFDDERIGYLKEFFKDKDYKVNFAEFESEDVIRLDFTEDGVDKTLRLNLDSGESNVFDVL